MGLNFNASLTIPASSIEHAISPSRYDISYYQSTLEAVQNINDKVTDLRISLYDIPNHQYVNEASIIDITLDKIIDMWKTISFIVLDTSIKTKYIVNDIWQFAVDQDPYRITWNDDGTLKSNINKDELLIPYSSLDHGDYVFANISTINANLYKMEFPHFKVLLFDDASTFIGLPDSDYKVHGIYDSLNKIFSAELDKDELKKLTSLIKPSSYRYASPCTCWIDINGCSGEFYNTFEEYRDHMHKVYGDANWTETLVTPDVLNMAINNFDKYATILNDLKELETCTAQNTAECMRVLVQHAIHSISNSAESLDYYDMESLIVLSSTILNMVKNRCQSYLMDLSIRCDILRRCIDNDNCALNKVSNVINHHKSVSTSISHLKESYLEDYNLSMFKFNEAYNLFRFQVALDGLYSLNEADNTNNVQVKSGPNINSDPSNIIEKIINNIKQMVQKWMMNANQLFGIDKKWFDANKGALNALGGDKRPFPNPNDDFTDWYNYDTAHVNRLKISGTSKITFDVNNVDLMNALESNQSFETYAFNQVFGPDFHPDENVKSASFQEKCKQAYSGGKSDKIKVSVVASMKNDMLTYCNDFLAGDNGGLFKSIKSDLANLDTQKNNAKNEINQYIQNQNNNPKNQNNQQAQNTEAKTAANTQQQAANSTQGNGTNSGTQQQGTGAKTESFSFDITNTLLNEVGAPASSNTNTQTGTNDNKDSDNKKSAIQTKANRYFTMMGNLLGARLTCAMQCYNQYKFVLKWALKNSTITNTNNNTEQKTSDNNKQTNSKKK